MRSYRNCFVVMVLVFAFAFLSPASGYSWPFGGAKKDASASNKTTDQKTAVVVNNAAGSKSNTTSSQSSEKTADTAVGVREDVPAQALPKTPRMPKYPKASDYNVKPEALKNTKAGEFQGYRKSDINAQATVKIEAEKFQTPVQAIPGAKSLKVANVAEDAEIAKIQDQIKDIIRLNESLKTQYSGQSAEIQKIGEQAKIHQKILEDLQKGPEKAPSVKSDELLQLEKIRVIKKETEDNHRFIEKLKESNNSQQGTEKPASQKVAI